MLESTKYNNKYQETFTKLKQWEMGITVLSEINKKGLRKYIIGMHVLYYSGVNKDQRAKMVVSVAIKKKYNKCVKDWKP